MTNIAIRDLEINEELDRAAMKNVTGGYYWWGVSQSIAMGSVIGPFGMGSWYRSSTRIAAGGGFWPAFIPGFGPYVTYPGNVIY
jgi:hypothetical protein